MRSRPERRLRGGVAALACAMLSAPLAAQISFPFPLPTLPTGGSGFPRLPFLAPPLPAVPADSPTHRVILKEFGGAITDEHMVPVVRIMNAISAATRPVSPPGGFRVTLLDSPQVNAFAVADGNTYVTRQLLALMNSEEELIGVMGHEAGHAIARHPLFTAAGRNSQRAGGSMLAILSPQFAGGATFAGTFGLRAFERAQEHQSDVGGVKVLADLGLDPLGMYRAIEILRADQELQNAIYGAPAPQQWDYWLRDHPADNERLGLIGIAVRAAPRASPGFTTNRAAFVRSLDGLMFDDGPREGIIDGPAFRQPLLRLAFDAPSGWTLRNGDGSTLAAGPQRARALFRHRAGDDDDVATAVRAMWLRERGKEQAPPSPTLGQVNGLDVALVSGQVGSGTTMAQFTLAAVKWPTGGVLEVLAIDPGGLSQEPIKALLSTIRAMPQKEAAAVKVRRIRVITPVAGDTVASLSRALAYRDRQEARFRMLNELGPDGALRKGVPVKLVVWSD